MRARSRRRAATVRVTCRRLRERGRDRRRRRRPGHPARRDREDLRALLHRPAGPGLRPEFRPRPVDLQADRRSAWRPDLGREPHRRARPADDEPQRAGRALRRAPAGGCDGRRRSTPPIHASAVLVGARAVLIRGPSGSGKSRLALALLHAAAQGLHAVRPAGRRRPRPCRSRARTAAGAPGRGAGRPDRGARARHPAGASRAASPWSGCWSISAQRTPNGCPSRQPNTG